MKPVFWNLQRFFSVFRCFEVDALEEKTSNMVKHWSETLEKHLHSETFWETAKNFWSYLAAAPRESKNEKFLGNPHASWSISPIRLSTHWSSTINERILIKRKQNCWATHKLTWWIGSICIRRFQRRAWISNSNREEYAREMQRIEVEVLSCSTSFSGPHSFSSRISCYAICYEF
jgi:hypothetical protein